MISTPVLFGSIPPIFTHTSLVEWIIIILLAALLPIAVRLLFKQIERRNRERRRHGTRERDCMRVPPRYWKKPDPYVYSQPYLMALGLEVTWDNPDFRLEQNGAVINGPVIAGENYDIVVTVHNGSTECPAFNVTAEFFMHDFGAGDKITRIGACNIPVVQVQGMGPTEVRCPWTAPNQGGHFCLVIKLTCVDDANPYNNEGQHNLMLVELTGAGIERPIRTVLTFPVRNRYDRELPLNLSVSSYELTRARTTPYSPPPLKEGEHDHHEFTGEPKEAVTDVEFRERAMSTRAERVQENRLGAFPLPDGWAASFPKAMTLQPNDRQIISISIDLPPGVLPGNYPVTVKATTPEGFLYGGTTTRLVVTK